MSSTARKTCLRCDWQGATKDTGCPDCGVPLYRAAPARPPKLGAQTRIAHEDRDATEPSTRASPPPESGSERTLARSERSAPSARTKALGASVVVALALAVSIGSWLRPDDAPTADGAITGSAPSITTGAIGPPPPPPAPPPAEHVVAGIPFSFDVPTGAWERFAFSINRSTIGSQGAEEIIFWTGLADSGSEVSPCVDVVHGWSNASMADLAATVATAPGTELVRGPARITVGGHPATRVTLVVRERQGCDPGYFFTWPHGECRGACWMRMGVGATIRLWIVDVDGRRIVIEAATTKQVTPELEREVGRIVRSIRFDT